MVSFSNFKFMIHHKKRQRQKGAGKDANDLGQYNLTTRTWMGGDRSDVKKIGLIVNPIAGMGGRVGLKGTDGAQTLDKARALGAVPEAPAKAARAMAKLVPLKDELVVVTCAGDMGESVARELGLTTEVVYDPGKSSEANGGAGGSTGKDTRIAA